MNEPKKEEPISRGELLRRLCEISHRHDKDAERLQVWERALDKAQAKAENDGREKPCGNPTTR